MCLPATERAAAIVAAARQRHQADADAINRWLSELFFHNERH